MLLKEVSVKSSLTKKIRGNFSKHRAHGRWLVLLLGGLTALDPLTVDMYLPAFHRIQEDFQTTMSQVELSLSSFFIGMAVGQLIYGPLADRFGRRKPLFAGMFVYFIATLLCTVSSNIYVFIGLRFLQSIGGCAGMVIARAIIRDLYNKRDSAIFLSYMALVMGVAPIVAPTLGAYVTAWWGWRAIFIFLAGMSVLFQGLVWIFLPETNTSPHKELKVMAPLKAYWGLLKNSQFMGYLIPDMMIRAGMFAYIAGSPFVFIQLLGIPEDKFGWIFGLNSMGLISASQVNRYLLNRWSPESILKKGILVAALTSAFVFIIAWSGPEKILFLSSIFVFLATLNFVSPNSLAGAMESQGRQAGTASAFYGCMQWCMASFSSFLISFLHNGTALPLAGVIMFCGLSSFTAYYFFVARRGTESV